jgi:hypothetical protein
MENNPVARLDYINLSREDLEVNSVFTTRVNAHVNLEMPGGLVIHTNLINYFYNTTNGDQVDASLTTVSKQLVTGNNFQFISMGDSVNRAIWYLGSDSTTLTTLSDNGWIQARVVSVSNMIQGDTLSANRVQANEVEASSLTAAAF